MTVLQILYDDDNKCFKIVDHELDPLVEQGVYVLGVTESGDPEVEFIEFRGSTVAQCEFQRPSCHLAWRAIAAAALSA